MSDFQAPFDNNQGGERYSDGKRKTESVRNVSHKYWSWGVLSY